MKKHTVTDQIEFLIETQQKLQQGEIDYSQASAQAKLSSAMAAHHRNQLIHKKFTGSPKSIKFLEG
jgi:hypothetical protein